MAKGRRHLKNEPRLQNTQDWQFYAGVVVGAVIAALPWVFPELDQGFKYTITTIAFLLIGVGVWTCPYLKRNTRRLVASGVVVLGVPLAWFFVAASYHAPIVFLTTTEIVKAPGDANLINLPNDGSTNLAIERDLVQPAGYRIASQSGALQLEITNDGSTAWSDFSLPLKVHYEMRPALPLNGDWSRIKNVIQDQTVRNCGWAVFCHRPIAAGGSLTLVFRNTSDAYAAIEFPASATVRFVGTDQPVDAKVQVTGDMVIPLSAIVVPPDRH